MSNSLSTGVPLLNGSNYALWEGPMEDYLRHKGHWAYLDMSEPDKDKQYKSWERWREAQSASVLNIGIFRIYLNFISSHVLFSIPKRLSEWRSTSIASTSHPLNHVRDITY